MTMVHSVFGNSFLYVITTLVSLFGNQCRNNINNVSTKEQVQLSNEHMECSLTTMFPSLTCSKRVRLVHGSQRRQQADSHTRHSRSVQDATSGPSPSHISVNRQPRLTS